MDNEKYYEVYDWSNFKDASENTKIIASLIPSLMLVVEMDSLQMN